MRLRVIRTIGTTTLIIMDEWQHEIPQMYHIVQKNVGDKERNQV